MVLFISHSTKAKYRNSMRKLSGVFELFYLLPIAMFIRIYACIKIQITKSKSNYYSIC